MMRLSRQLLGILVAFFVAMVWATVIYVFPDGRSREIAKDPIPWLVEMVSLAFAVICDQDSDGYDFLQLRAPRYQKRGRSAQLKIKCSDVAVTHVECGLHADTLNSKTLCVSVISELREGGAAERIIAHLMKATPRTTTPPSTSICVADIYCDSSRLYLTCGSHRAAPIFSVLASCSSEVLIFLVDLEANVATLPYRGDMEPTCIVHIRIANKGQHVPRSTDDVVVKEVRQQNPGFVALMDRARPTGPYIPVLRSGNDREFQLFWNDEDDEMATATETYLRKLLKDQLPRTDVVVGGRLAAGLTEAIKAVRGGGEVVRFSGGAIFTVEAPSTLAQPPSPDSPSRDVAWRVFTEPDWTWTCSGSGDDNAGLAYGLEFRMDGLDQLEPEKAVMRQLTWGGGIKMERRGRAVAETVTVTVMGPAGQRLRAFTSLQEHNVGESGAPVVVRVSEDGTVRMQFWPGQIDDS